MSTESTTDVFIGTTIQKAELTAWILSKFPKYRITEIRYFGSRIFGKPQDNSDIDVYILFDKKSPSGKPIFTELYKDKNSKTYQIEFHAFIDFYDDYVPIHLIGLAKKELLNQ